MSHDYNRLDDLPPPNAVEKLIFKLIVIVVAVAAILAVVPVFH